MPRDFPARYPLDLAERRPAARGHVQAGMLRPFRVQRGCCTAGEGPDRAGTVGRIVRDGTVFCGAGHDQEVLLLAMDYRVLLKSCRAADADDTGTVDSRRSGCRRISGELDRARVRGTSELGPARAFRRAATMPVRSITSWCSALICLLGADGVSKDDR